MELIIFIVHCDLFLRHVQRENMMIFIARLRGENVHENGLVCHFCQTLSNTWH